MKLVYNMMISGFLLFKNIALVGHGKNWKDEALNSPTHGMQLNHRGGPVDLRGNTLCHKPPFSGQIFTCDHLQAIFAHDEQSVYFNPMKVHIAVPRLFIFLP